MEFGRKDGRGGSKECVERAEDRCQQIPGGGRDEASGASLGQSVTPLAFEVPLDRALLSYVRVDPNDRRFESNTLEAQRNEEAPIIGSRKGGTRQAASARLRPTQRRAKEPGASVGDGVSAPAEKPKTPDRDSRRMARLLLKNSL